MHIESISCDIETFSDIDLQKCGVYRYIESDRFRILLFGYSINNGPVHVVDLEQGECIPQEVISALTDDRVIKWAFNAAFERVCLSKFLGLPQGRYLKPSSWRCSMIWSAYLGLPLSLKGVGAVLKLDKQKMDEGKDLIRYFCKPCYSAFFGEESYRHLPSDDAEKWNLFKAYNKRDVETELAIKERLSNFPVPDFVWEEYAIDQAINDRGVLVDMQLVTVAIKLDEESKANLTARMKEITELQNPNSVAQMKEWLKAHGTAVESLGKKEVKALLDEVPPEIREALELRLKLARSSIKKYQAMMNTACRDGRTRGMFQFYGANRTGRFSGRLIQLQNLRQNHIENLEEARTLIKAGKTDSFDDLPDTLSQLIRTAFIAKPGMRFIVSDYSAIEARVIAWLSGEEWRQEVFRKNGDIYSASASKMFGVPVAKHGPNAELRQKGKQAELACIAEGELVLTDKGLIPIERVTTEEKLWDGESWVSHKGVIYKGEKEVIEYEGLRATHDHLVWVEGKEEPVQLGEAASGGAHLLQTGDGGRAIRLGENNLIREALEQELEDNFSKVRLYDIRDAGEHHRFTVSNHLVHNCGYGGSVGALTAMGALDMGLKEEELQPLVDNWRQSNPHIVAFWWEVDRAVKKAIKEQTVVDVKGLKFSKEKGMLFIRLLSGRRLAYAKPRIATNKWGSESVSYEGIGSTKKWERIESYGPKFVENIVQATSRDILCFAMKNLRNTRICMHIHDEVVIEAPSSLTLEEVTKTMSIAPSWADGLVLNADGYETEFYKKD